ncbi:MAG: hypothetical protein K9M49_02815 [Candidatus Marinimicrobia bacterium]|nr:hypothetical protein [Candidatus Neomarinimicrobiota bacterium]MCF7904066.1 hypothetical protein [Candidatus Neomarinimicrobiota bacterium]
MKANKQHASRLSYGIEIFIVLTSLTGVYFIISDFDLATMTKEALGVMFDALREVKQYVMVGFARAASQLSLSDTIGIILIAITLILSILRIRDRLVRSRDMIEYCPECGVHLTKGQRNFGQKVISKSLGLTSASFQCGECDFQNVIYRYRLPANNATR